MQPEVFPYPFVLIIMHCIFCALAKKTSSVETRKEITMTDMARYTPDGGGKFGEQLVTLDIKMVNKMTSCWKKNRCDLTLASYE